MSHYQFQTQFDFYAYCICNKSQLFTVCIEDLGLTNA